MKSEYAAQYERLEREHWWWLARRRIVGAELDHLADELQPGTRSSLLDIGCGAGVNLASFKKDFDCEGLEPNRLLAEAARKNSGVPIREETLNAVAASEGRTFDFVLLLDVIEHIDEDLLALKTAANLLAPGGAMLINVPAMPWLWSVHDEVNEHKRRYTTATLERLITEAGLRSVFLRYWAFSLAPVAFGVRKVFGRNERPSSYKVSIPNRHFGRVLEILMLAEYRITSGFRLPFGTSVIAAVVKR